MYNLPWVDPRIPCLDNDEDGTSGAGARSMLRVGRVRQRILSLGSYVG